MIHKHDTPMITIPNPAFMQYAAQTYADHFLS